MPAVGMWQHVTSGDGLGGGVSALVPRLPSGRMPIRGKCFPRLFLLPDTHSGHLRPLPYLSSLCMHLFIVNIFDL